MAIPSRQIGWSTKANLLWQISKQLERLTCVTAGGCGPTTSTSTTSALVACSTYTINAVLGATHVVQYIPCGQTEVTDVNIPPESPSEVICAENPLIDDSHPANTILGGECFAPTTTTTTTII